MSRAHVAAGLCRAECAIFFFGSIFEDATMKLTAQVTRFPQLKAFLLAAGTLFMANSLPLQAAQDSQPADWPQSASDLKPDPAILFGSLPNGMRYAIVKNATPAGQVALRLRIASGSLRESDAQQGLAHLLEHMAFKGSTHVPQGEMIKILQRKGLAFGPDTNAFTGQRQTVYMLDLPEADADTTDTGLMLLRETASELTLDAGALESERGVVLSEERLRDTPQYRAFMARTKLLLEGQLAARRFPIGKVDVIRNAPVSLIRDYYRDNYRPERATLIAVGDTDPAVMEAKIKALFGDWKAVGEATPDPDIGETNEQGLRAQYVVEPGSGTKVEIAWAHPYDDVLDTEAKRREELVDSLGLAVLRRRFNALAGGQTPPFLGAGASFGNLMRSVKVASVTASSKEGGWREALAALDQEQRCIVAFGVRQEELDREIAVQRKNYEQWAAGAATRQTKDLASSLVNMIDQNRVFAQPADDLARFERAAKTVTVAEVNAALVRIFTGAGPLVLVISPDPIDGGDQALAAEYKKAHASEVSATKEDEALVWPYESFGPTGAVAERTEIVDLGLTAVSFANGVRLNVKPTSFKSSEILVNVRVGNGRIDLKKDSPVWLTEAFIEGGLKSMTEQNMARVLAGKAFSARLSLGDGAFVLDGRTRPEDLIVELQVLAAYVVDPAYRSDAIKRQRAKQLSRLTQMGSTPSGVDARDRERLLHLGDARWGTPLREEVESAKAASLRAMLGGPLSAGPIEVTIVGDITPDAAILASSQTFGALSARPAPALPPGEPSIAFPAATSTPVERTHAGRADASIAYVAWKTDDFFAEPSGASSLVLAAEVLKSRLTDQIRVAEGATYSPRAGSFASTVSRGYGYVWCSVETPPDKIASFFANVSRITADMRANGVTADELLRAKTPIVERLKKAQVSNDYWLHELAGSQADPRRLDRLRTVFTRYGGIGADDIKRVTSAYLTNDRAWKFVIVPDSNEVTSTSGGDVLSEPQE
jgi:zinc protease